MKIRRSPCSLKFSTLQTFPDLKFHRLAKLKLWWISCWYDFPNFNQFNFFHPDNAIAYSIGSHLFLNKNYLVIICHAHSQISQYEHVFYMTSCVFQVLYQCCSFSFLICLFLLFSKGSVAMWPNYARGGSKRAFLVRQTFFICCAQIISRSAVPRLHPDYIQIQGAQICPKKLAPSGEN